MVKRDILELKRRFKKEDCTITRVCGCYVNGTGEKVTKIGETFLNMEDEEFYKYLEIAKKTLSGVIGNNLLELHMKKEECAEGGKQQFYMALKESKLKNEELLDRFYDLIIENYDYTGNYLILVFHDVYDVMTRTSDNKKLDESEEVYEYLLCAVCPVALSKPALGYRKDENRIGARIRDWVVGNPDIGFVFPAFSERSADIEQITYYVKNPKEAHQEVMEEILGCIPIHTATEQDNILTNIIKSAVGSEAADPDETVIIVKKNLKEVAQIDDCCTIPVPLTQSLIAEAIKKAEIPEYAVKKVTKEFESTFNNEEPIIQDIVNEKEIDKYEKEKKVEQLEKKVKALTSQLGTEASGDDVKTYDVVLRVNEEKERQIKVESIDGSRYLMIPVTEKSYVNVNGMTKSI